MRKLCPQILKLYAWEPSFQNLVGGIRKKEIKILKDKQLEEEKKHLEFMNSIKKYDSDVNDQVKKM